MLKRRERAGRNEEEGRWVRLRVVVVVMAVVRMQGTANMVRLAVVDGERSPLGYSVANIY